MTLNQTASTEEFEQQVHALLSGSDIAKDDKAVLVKFALQGQAKWLGTLKSRQDNLARAIVASVEYLQSNDMSLSDESIIQSLRVIDAGARECHEIIYQIVDWFDIDDDNYVGWVDQRGIERETSFTAIKQRIKTLNRKAMFR
jgi:hypothetical protein